MIRVYFDCNVFANLKRASKEPFTSILKIIHHNKGKLLFPYSYSHLRDLKRGFSQSETAKEKTYIDLKLLHEISQDHCLHFEVEHKVTAQIIDPIDYFNQFIEDGTVENVDFENLISDSVNELSGLWKASLEKMKAIPSGFDLTQLEITSEKYGVIKRMFPNLQNGNNLYNLIKDVTGMF